MSDKNIVMKLVKRSLGEDNTNLIKFIDEHFQVKVSNKRRIKKLANFRLREKKDVNTLFLDMSTVYDNIQELMETNDTNKIIIEARMNRIIEHVKTLNIMSIVITLLTLILGYYSDGFINLIKGSTVDYINSSNDVQSRENSFYLIDGFFSFALSVIVVSLLCVFAYYYTEERHKMTTAVYLKSLLNRKE